MYFNLFEKNKKIKKKKMSLINQQQIDDAINIAISMKTKSYCSYSKFRVGAALISKSGKIYSGKKKNRSNFNYFLIFFFILYI